MKYSFSAKELLNDSHMLSHLIHKPTHEKTYPVLLPFLSFSTVVRAPFPSEAFSPASLASSLNKSLSYSWGLLLRKLELTYKGEKI